MIVEIQGGGTGCVFDYRQGENVSNFFCFCLVYGLQHRRMSLFVIIKALGDTYSTVVGMK